MNFNSSGYFAYKKNKIQREIEQQKKPISRLSFLCQLFAATFTIIFIVLVVGFMKYSSKMDIEYTKGELQVTNANFNSASNYTVSAPLEEERQRKIDDRLRKIQEQENAPSEAKIIEKPKDNHDVIAQAHIEENKRIEKLEKQKRLQEQKEAKNGKVATVLDEIKLQKKLPIETYEPSSNQTIMSKVLIGHYATFEEAQSMQNQIKSKNPTLQPFVKKVGGVFSVQMGSYQDFNVAKAQAQFLSSKGLDVWIYQQ